MRGFTVLICASNHVVDLHKPCFSERFYQFSSSNLKFMKIFNFAQFPMNLYKNNQNADILNIIKIFLHCNGRFAAN